MAEHHDVELTPVRRRRHKTSGAISDCPASRITYQHTVLCQTALPYRDPGADVREWERQQGAVALKVTAGEVRDPSTQRFVKLGLPYGSRPRLILIHLNRQALLKGSPRIEVEDSLTAFIRRIQRSVPNGREIRRFKEQLSHLAAASMRMAIDLSPERALQLDTKIVDVMELWLTKDERQRVLWPQIVELSPRYFESLTRHAVPLDERAIAALSNSPMALDIYAWLAQRLHRIPVGKPQKISWQALYEQFGHGFARLRDFRADFLKVLALVHSQYPGARLEADKTGLELANSPPPVADRLAIIPKRLG
jgi:Plasmid encoded RepA protein